MWRRTDDKFFGDFVFRESERKDEIAASYYVNCESAIELTNKHIGGYKLKELTPNIIQQYYDKLDRAEKTVTVVTAKPTLREKMKTTGVGYMKLRYEKGFSSCSLANALAGKRISYEYAKRLTAAFNESVDALFDIKQTKQRYAHEIFNYLSVGGQGGSIGPKLLLETPIPLIENCVKNKISGLYYNEQDNSGILQLDAQISILKGKLKRILTEIKDE